ncbi:MAG TPA: glycosyltransferase family 4 protein [Acidimicrobiales bacterium]|nr:glycosyltransferase family 4 protein [Acidimicrobiales bacterium]
MSADAERLRVAYLVYRGNPRCGGQGVYTRHLTGELSKLGHEVTVFSGPPYPELEEGVEFVPVPSLDLYREPDPFRVPRLREFKSSIDALEFAVMCTAGFPEPRTFTLRARRLLAQRKGDFDVVHDNQSLGSGLLGIMRDGWPLLGTIHHPITVDRELDLSHADTIRRRLTLRRWYGFIRMQSRVAQQIPRVVTVSESSCRDIADQFGVEPSRMAVVPVGVDEAVFRPRPEIARVPGRLVTTASADVPMKGLIPLLEALAKMRTEREDAHLVVVGRLRDGSQVPGVLDRLGLEGAVRFLSGISDDELSELYGSAEVAVVPSLYEGFSLPAIEAMASGVPLVATTGGALPEVAGTSGVTALLVPPNDPGALAAELLRVLADRELRARIGAAGRQRTLERFTWPVTARLTAEQYRVLLGERERSRRDGRPDLGEATTRQELPC